MKYISQQKLNNEVVFLETESLRTDLVLSSRVIVVNGNKAEITFQFNELLKNKEDESNLVLEAECKELELISSVPVNDLEELCKQCINLVENDRLPDENEFIDGLIRSSIDSLFSSFRRDNLVENIEYNNIIGLIKSEDESIFGTIDGFIYAKNSLEIIGNYDFIKDLSDEKNVIIDLSLGNVAYRVTGDTKDNVTINIRNIEKISLNEIPESFKEMKTIDDFFGDKDEYLVYRRGLILDQQDKSMLSINIDDLDF